MAIRRRISSGKIKYQVIIRKKGYETISKLCSSEKEAQQFQAAVLRDISSGRIAPLPLSSEEGISGSTSLASVIHLYFLKYGPRLADEGKRDKNRCKVILKRLGSMQLSSINKSVIQGYIQVRLSDKAVNRKHSVSAQTVRHEVGLLKRIFNKLEEDSSYRFPEGNPAHISYRNHKALQLKARDVVLQEEDDSKLLFECKKSRNKDLYDLVVLAIETAARKGELLHMCYEDIDWRAGVYKLKKQFDKNREGRDIILTARAQAIIQKRLEQSSSKKGLVFDGTSYDGIQRSFKRACERAGISNLRFHDLRHTAVTRVVDKTNMPIFQVQIYSGHKSLSMLNRYYNGRVDLVAEKLRKVQVTQDTEE